MKNRHVLVAILVTYLLVSFVPALSLSNLVKKAKGGK